jgi:hypothetical protein
MPIDNRSHRQAALAVCGQVRVLHNTARADQHNRQRLPVQSAE